MAIFRCAVCGHLPTADDVWPIIGDDEQNQEGSQEQEAEQQEDDNEQQMEEQRRAFYAKDAFQEINMESLFSLHSRVF